MGRAIARQVGEWVRPSSGDTIRVVNPATEEACATVPAGKPADIDRAVAAARAAFDRGPWPQMTPAERIEWMRKLSQGLGVRMPDIAMAITEAMGCPLATSQFMQALPATIVLDKYVRERADENGHNSGTVGRKVVALRKQ